jgi:WD40 repeat protein
MRGLALVPEPPAGPPADLGAGVAASGTALPEAVTALAPAGAECFWSGCADGSVRLHGSDGVELRRWAAHGGGVSRLCPRPGSDMLASAGDDGRVCLWRAGELQQVLLQADDWVEQMAWSPDGRILAASAGRNLHLWRDGTPIDAGYVPGGSVLALAWSAEARLAIAANNTLQLWQADAGAPTPVPGLQGAPIVLGWRADGRALAAGTQDGVLQVWRLAETGVDGDKKHAGSAGGSQLTMRGYPAKVRCVRWHPRCSRVATTGGSDVVVWDVPERGPGRATPLRAHETAVTVLAYAPDGDLLASADRAGRICLWRDGSQPLQRFSLQAEATTLLWSADGAALVVGTIDGRLHVHAGLAGGGQPPARVDYQDL